MSESLSDVEHERSDTLRVLPHKLENPAPD